MVITMRRNSLLLDRFDRINELTGLNETRPKILDKALRYAACNGDEKSIIEAQKLWVKNYQRDSIPENIKIQVEEEIFGNVVEKVGKCFKLKRVQYPFVCKLALSMYIIYLQNRNGDRNENILSKQLSVDEFKLLEINEKLNMIYQLLTEMYTRNE